MKITQSEFRRLHFKGRALDRVCRILWPAPGDLIRNGRSAEGRIELIREAIGDYRPEPQEGVSVDRADYR